MYSIVAPDQFLRQARRFFKRHPDLKPKFTRLVSELQKDPFAPRLGLHPLKGRLRGCYAVRLSHSYCITLTLAPDENEILLLDVGSHDDVYR